jgi:hypothetical protein
MATYGGDRDGEDLSNTEIQGKLRELEQGLDVLRRRYEQFFVGNRDRPPKNERRKVSRLVRELQRANLTNTSHKFKLRGLMQRFNTYKNKWNRVERQIEEGTYEPHQKRAQQRMEESESEENGESEREEAAAEELDEETEPDESAPGDGAYELDVDADVDLEEVEREFEQMDEEGAFEDHVQTDRVDVETDEDGGRSQPSRRNTDPSGGEQRSRAAASSETDFDEERESSSRKENLRKLQDELGLSKGSGNQGGDDEERRRKLSKVRERLDRKRKGDDTSQGGESSQSSGTTEETSFDRDRNLETTKKIDSLDDRNSPASHDDDRGGDTRPDRSKVEHSESSRGGSSNGPPNRVDRESRRERGTDDDRRTSRDEARGHGSKRDASSSRRRGGSDRGHATSDDSSPASSDDEDESETRRLYEQWVRAKESCSQSTEDVTFETIERSLETERARIAHRRRIDRDAISFRVVLKDGDAYFQANFDA